MLDDVVTVDRQEHEMRHVDGEREPPEEVGDLLEASARRIAPDADQQQERQDREGRPDERNGSASTCYLASRDCRFASQASRLRLRDALSGVAPDRSRPET